MPKVKMLVSMAGIDFSIVPGEVVEVAEDAAEAWTNAGIAELVEEEKPKKKTAIKKGETE